MTRYYHGTPESSADEIHKSGFKGSEVHASTSARTADAFGKRYGKDTRTISIRVPSKSKNVERTQGQQGVDAWGRKHHSVVMSPEYATKHITKSPTVPAPKVPKKYQDLSPFKRRTKTQIPKTVEEAKRMRVLNLIHSTSRDNKKRIHDSGFKDSPSTGSYGQGVYTSPSRRVTRDYGHSDVNLRIVNPKVHSTDSPKQFRTKMRNWVKDSSDDDLAKGKNKPVDPRKQAKAAIESGKKIVRVPDAHENPTRKDLPKGSYVVVDKDMANRSIAKNPQPTFRASGKPRRTKTQPKRK